MTSFCPSMEQRIQSNDNCKKIQQEHVKDTDQSHYENIFKMKLTFLSY